MLIPEFNKPYIFVRQKGDCIEATVLIVHEDGSCGFNVRSSDYGDGTYMSHIYEFDPESWKKALRDLDNMGFVELQEAKSRHIVPPEWESCDQIDSELNLFKKLAQRERPEWISENGDIDLVGFYRSLKEKGWKEQTIFRHMRLFCGLNYRQFKTLIETVKDAS